MSQSPTPDRMPRIVFDPHEFAPLVPLHNHQRSLPPGLSVLSGRMTTSMWRGTMLPPEHGICIQLREGMDIQGTHSKPFHVIMQPGSTFMFSQGIPLTYERSGSGDQLVIFFTSYLFTTVALQTDCTSTGCIELIDRFEAYDAFMLAISQEILNTLQNDGIASDLYLESLMQTLVIYLLRSYAVFPAQPPLTQHKLAPHIVSRVLDYIHSHTDHNLTLAEIAAVVHLSPYHLARLFKQTTGQSLHQYVLNQRLTLGKQLLETSDVTVSGIAAQLGFTDHSHFSQQFKRYFGYPPSKISRPRKNIHIVSKDLLEDLDGTR